MPIGAILVGIAMLLGTIPFVINPLLSEKRKKHAESTHHEYRPDEDRHSELLLALRDLEFDHQIGKISDEDYSGLRDSLMVQAAMALEAQEKQQAELDIRIEQAIQQRRNLQPSKRVCLQCGNPLAESDRFCRACGKAVEVKCPKCGERLQANDVFCGSCGEQLSSIKMILPVEGS